MSPSLWLITALIAALALAVAIPSAWKRAARRPATPVDEWAADLLAAGLLPLSDCPRGRDACLRCLHVDRCVAHRLLELGLTPGTEVRVVQDAGGPMLVSVRGSRIALGRDLAERMWVELAKYETTDNGRQTTQPATGGFLLSNLQFPISRWPHP